MSDAPTNTTQGVSNPDSPMLKTSRFMGYKCAHLDPDTYHVCCNGKKKGDRWMNYVKDERTREELKRLYSSNKRLLISNIETGSMSFIK